MSDLFAILKYFLNESSYNSFLFTSNDNLEVYDPTLRGKFRGLTAVCVDPNQVFVFFPFLSPQLY